MKKINNDLQGKKLLILGANPETTPLVQLANELGIKTIVTSHKPDDVAKKYAWKSANVDGLDVQGLINLAVENQVDGVLVGVADILILPYCKVCEALNLPCYATEEIVKIFSFKDQFKATCERYGIHGVPEYNLDNISEIKYPVMVKPVDGYSGLGMTVCFSENDLQTAINKALTFSKSKKFLIERYMQCDDMGIYYTFKDGECSASCVYDRYTSNEQKGLSKVCLGGTYPSKHIEDYFEKMHGKAVKMFQDIGIKNGVLMFSAFYENGEFYVYDPGFRLQGEAPHLLMNAVNKFDQRELLINFALTGSEGDIDLKNFDDPYFRGKWAATLWFLLKKGKINKIEGLDSISNDKRVIANVQRLYKGDEISDNWIGTEKQVLTRLYIVCDSKVQLAETLAEYMNKVKVFDIAGNNMLLQGFDIKRALEL